METFAKRLRELRLEMNLLPMELADKLGASASSVSRWESGKSAVSNENTIKLAKFFGVTTDYLFGLDDNRTRAISAPATSKILMKTVAVTIRK